MKSRLTLILILAAILLGCNNKEVDMSPFDYYVKYNSWRNTSIDSLRTLTNSRLDSLTTEMQGSKTIDEITQFYALRDSLLIDYAVHVTDNFDEIHFRNIERSYPDPIYEKVNDSTYSVPNYKAMLLIQDGYITLLQEFPERSSSPSETL